MFIFRQQSLGFYVTPWTHQCPRCQRTCKRKQHRFDSLIYLPTDVDESSGRITYRVLPISIWIKKTFLVFFLTNPGGRSPGEGSRRAPQEGAGGTADREQSVRGGLLPLPFKRWRIHETIIEKADHLGLNLRLPFCKPIPGAPTTGRRGEGEGSTQHFWSSSPARLNMLQSY